MVRMYVQLNVMAGRLNSLAHLTDRRLAPCVGAADVDEKARWQVLLLELTKYAAEAVT
jgi:hypothetical protein